MNRSVYAIVGVAVIAIAIISIALLSSPDIDTIIANKDCSAAMKFTDDNLDETTAEQQLKLGALIGGCLASGGSMESDAAKQATEILKKISPKNIVYKWPESIGDSPDNPIKLPYTLDENYMRSDLGIGGCEITINGLRSDPANSEFNYYLDITVRSTGDAKSCEINGKNRIIECLADRKKPYSPHCNRQSFVDAGDVLVGIDINTDNQQGREPSGQMYGFFFRGVYNSHGFDFGGSIDADTGDSIWLFDEEKSHTWNPGVYISSTQRVGSGAGLFASYWNIALNPTNVELAFLDASELEKYPEYEEVNLNFRDIQYLKYFEIKYLDP